MDRRVERSIGRGRPAPLAAAALVGLMAALVAGCGAAPAPSPAPADAPTGAPTAAPTAPTPAPSPVTVDPALLAALPPSVGEVTIVELPDAEAEALADASVAPVAERLAVGYGASADRSDWAIAWVVALRPDTDTDAVFRSWRDTYDEGACAGQGGPGGHAETGLGGRTVFITTCGPLVVHHVRLEAPDRLVAITSTGPARLGERIAAALRP